MLLPLFGAGFLARSGVSARKASAATLVWFMVSTVWIGGMGNGSSFVLPWLPDAGMELRFTIDGLSWLFLMLTGIVLSASAALMLISGTAERGMTALMLVLQSALIGVFTARHFIPWFLCWEMTLLPAYFLIRLWGGTGAKTAARRFMLMTLGGSALLLVGFLAIQVSVGTMDFQILATRAHDGLLADNLQRSFAFTGASGHSVLTIIALMFFVGLAVKLPVVPFHAWLPNAYVEAPTPVTMLLTGLLSKMAVFSMLRIFLPVFSEVLPALAPLLIWLAVLTILLGAVAAMAQTDLKRMLAYSSVNHLGYCALALAAVAHGTGDRATVTAAVSGTVLQAFNHGIIATALFFGLGLLEQRGKGSRGLNDFGGLRTRMPVFTGAFGLAVFASLGLPGLSGFVGEFLMFRGAFAVTPGATALAVPGLLFTAVFLLRMLRLVFWGPLCERATRWRDLNQLERCVFALLILLIVLPGLSPGVLLNFANPDIVKLVDLLPMKP